MGSAHVTKPFQPLSQPASPGMASSARVNFVYFRRRNDAIFLQGKAREFEIWEFYLQPAGNWEFCIFIACLEEAEACLSG